MAEPQLVKTSFNGFMCDETPSKIVKYRERIERRFFPWSFVCETFHFIDKG